MKFGNHTPTVERAKGMPSPMAVFTRGLQIGGSQWKFTFPNGYGASVISDGYGGEDGLYELAVLDSAGNLTYETPVTDDVLGWLTESDVAAALDRIADLPTKATA